MLTSTSGAKDGKARFKQHDKLTSDPAPRSRRDHLSISAVLALFPTLSNWPTDDGYGHRGRVTHGGRAILEWLQKHPGETWQDRWIVSGADRDASWIDDLIVPGAPTSPVTQRGTLVAGLGSILLCQIVRPSYEFLHSYRFTSLLSHVRQTIQPELFAQLEERGHQIEDQPRRVRQALAVISKIVLHTGRKVDQIKANDLLAYRTWHRQRSGTQGGIAGLTVAWTLLHGAVDLGEHATLKDAVRFGQRPTAELVDHYQLQCSRVRDVLVRYLEERRPALDYSSFRQLVYRLAGRFWADLERHHPGIDTLDLPSDVAKAWKQRLQTVVLDDGTSRPRKDYHIILMAIRAFYRDVQEWAHEDPSWAEWSASSPVRKSDIAGQVKARKKTTAEMHQRVRERMPHLPLLVDTAEQRKNELAGLVAAAAATPLWKTFDHSGHSYRRIIPKAYETSFYRGSTPPLQIEDVVTGEITDVDKAEHEAFWAWAVIEVLRHTGIRIEELLEITHLALVSYKLPDTGEVVPMLQIVPSKANEERLLLISPELASVLAIVVSRLRRSNGGAVPLTARYDIHERVIGPPLPHLFQHRVGSWQVPSPNTIYKLLDQTLAHTGLTDAAGDPLRYTPHDFRRMFATDAVSNGLPVHIVARLLGHANINTTQAYMAVFAEELVRSYRTFLDNRRALRPEAEYREPTEQEWQEFQQHFQLRKLELGECGRPYGTPCKHEHACIRCPSLRLGPTARPRLLEIIENLRARIEEAKLNRWLGEAQGLDASLQAASRKLVHLDRMRDRQHHTGPVNLGIPVITDPG